MQKSECFLLGRIARKHSFKGEVVAKFETDFPEKYQELESVFLENQGELVPFFIENLRILPKGVRLKFEGIDTEADAERILGKEMWLSEEFLPQLDADQLYFHEVIDLEVIDQNHGLLGTIEEVLEGSEQLTLQIVHASGAKILIPWVDEFVLEIDKEGRKMQVNCPPGLVELYLG